MIMFHLVLVLVPVLGLFLPDLGVAEDFALVFNLP